MDNNKMIVWICITIIILYAITMNEIVAFYAIYKNAKYRNSIGWNLPILKDLSINTEVN